MDPIKLINNTFHVNLGSWTPIQSHAQNGNAGVGSSHSTSAPKAPHTAAPTATSGAHASPRDTVQLGHGHQEPDYNPRQLRERFGAKPASAEWAKECQTPTRPTSAPPTRPTSAPPTRPSSTPPAQKPVLPPQPPHSQKPATIHETPAAPPSRPSGPSFGQRLFGATQRLFGATQRLFGATQRLFGAAGVVMSGLQVKTGVEQMKAANLDRDVVSRAIDGELQHSEDCRAVGDVEGAQRSAERLTGFRAQQARVRAVYGDQPFAQ